MGTIISGKEAQTLEITEEAFLLEHYVPSKGITFLYGKYSTYKSPITIHIAKSICTGTSLLGLKVEQATPVLYVEADMHKSTALGRMQPIGIGVDGLDISFCYPGTDIINPNSGTKEGEVYEELVQAHKEKRYKLVVIDALRRIHRLKLTDDDSPALVYYKLETMFDGAAIIVIHHDNKTRIMDKGQRATATQLEELAAESFAGSQGWINNAAIGIHARSNGTEDSITLTHTKSQVAARRKPLSIDCLNGGVVLSLSKDLQAPDEEVTQFILSLRDRGMSPTEIDGEVSKFLGVSVSTAKRKRRVTLKTELGPDSGVTSNKSTT